MVFILAGSFLVVSVTAKVFYIFLHPHWKSGSLNCFFGSTILCPGKGHRHWGMFIKSPENLCGINGFCYKVEERWIMKFPEKIWFIIVFSKWVDKHRIIKDCHITGSDTMKKPHGHNHSISELEEHLGVIQSPSHVQLFVAPWTAAHQASLSLTISQSLPKFMSIASVMPSSDALFSFCPHSLEHLQFS